MYFVHNSKTEILPTDGDCKTDMNHTASIYIIYVNWYWSEHIITIATWKKWF